MTMENEKKINNSIQIVRSAFTAPDLGWRSGNRSKTIHLSNYQVIPYGQFARSVHSLRIFQNKYSVLCFLASLPSPPSPPPLRGVVTSVRHFYLIGGCKKCNGKGRSIWWPHAAAWPYEYRPESTLELSKSSSQKSPLSIIYYGKNFYGNIMFFLQNAFNLLPA